MYHIYGLSFNQSRLSIECLLDYPIKSKLQAKIKFFKVIKLSAQGMSAGLFDASKGKWLSTCNHGRSTPEMTQYLNDNGFGPSSGKGYFVANVKL